MHPKLLTITWWCAKIRISPSLSASPPASIIDFVIESIGPGWTKPPQQQNLNQNDRSNFYCWTCSLCARQALTEDRILEFLRVSLSLYCWIVDQSIIAVVVKQNRFQKGQLFAHLLGLQITSWSNSYLNYQYSATMIVDMFYLCRALLMFDTLLLYWMTSQNVVRRVSVGHVLRADPKWLHHQVEAKLTVSV